MLPPVLDCYHLLLFHTTSRHLRERAAAYMPHSRSLLSPSHAPLRARDPAWDMRPQPARHLLDIKPVSSLLICLAIADLHLTFPQPYAPE